MTERCLEDFEVGQTFGGSGRIRIDKERIKSFAAEFDPQVRHRMISEAAYRLYARRGYVEGFELEDWLQAEAEVDRQLDSRSVR